MKRSLAILVLCLCCAAMTWAQQVDASLSYLYQNSNTIGGQSLNFDGGRADIDYTMLHNFALVGEFSGVETASIGSRPQGSSPQGAVVYTYLTGLRYTLPILGARSKTQGKDPITFFGQFLAGGARGTDGAFPVNGTLIPNANSFAYSAGGGMNVALARHISLRLVQADYLFTQLPNLAGTGQNHFRIGAGLVIHLRGLRATKKPQAVKHP